MKKVLYFSFSFLMFLNVTNSTFAQDAPNKRLQAGMTGNFGMDFQKMGDSKMVKDGIGTDLSVGVILHSSFKNSANLGIATGLEFDFETIRYKSNSDSVFYNFIDTDILQSDETGGTQYQMTKREIKPVYVTIPLMLLFRTEAIGDFKFFGKFGLRNSFLVSQKISDEGVNVSTHLAQENTNMKSFGETFFYKGSIGFSAGAEWNFVGTTCLVPELGFYYGLTPMHYRFSEDNYTLYTGANNYFYTKAKQNQLILKVSILF